LKGAGPPSPPPLPIIKYPNVNHFLLLIIIASATTTTTLPKHPHFRNAIYLLDVSLA
jgi:hypothetical protein